MIKLYCCLLFSIGYPWWATAQSQLFDADLSSSVTTPRHYIVPKTRENIKIDGRANEKCWKTTPFSEPFIDIEGVKTPTFNTQVKMLWDDAYLYIYAEMEEPHIWGNITKRDSVIFYNNDFEVFIDPSDDTYNYGEIEINALGTVWDLLLDKPYRLGGKPNNSWNLEALKTAVHLNGSLNDPSDIDTSWSVEMAIPLGPLVALKDKPAGRPRSFPKEGEQWRINFSRVQWDHDLINETYKRKKVNGKIQPEYNWVWSSQGKINMHIPEKWGYIQFTEKSNPVAVNFIQDDKQALKQIAMALFREVRFGSLQHLRQLNTYTSVSLNVKLPENKSLIAEYTKTALGFELKIPDTKGKYTCFINEQGVPRFKASKTADFVFATWVHGSANFDKDVWTEKLAGYKELGFSELLIGGSPEFLSELVPLASTFEIKIHAWMWTLNRPNDTTANKHPEWYAVNREGKNSLEYRAYVDYYQWLSPFHPEARAYIKDNVRKLAQVEGLASIHLDYVRYADVILGKDLQPKYNLIQDREMPQFDYGYHPIAREGFKTIFGYDPLELEHPELSTEWRQYRLNAITSLVNELVQIAHEKGHKMTAAVFPFPEMSRQMVRQAWNDWQLDAAYPMLYQNFYQETVNWIGFATAQGVSDADFPVYSGLYSPALKDPKELENAIMLAKQNGASGVSIFTADDLSDEQKAVFIRLKKDLLEK